MGKFTELIPKLPEEIALACLTRMHYAVHEAASRVCVTWCRLLQCKEFYNYRKQSGFTYKTACFVQSFNVLVEQGTTNSNSKLENKPKLGLSIFEPSSGIWDQVDPVPKYLDGVPLFCQVASSEGKLVMMGGWNPGNWEPLLDVFVYDFATRRWTQRVNMPSTRSLFAAGAYGGKIFVAGGHDKGKNALKTACMYDISSDIWTELAPMSEERDECEGVVIGSEFWVVSGYETDSQGRFKNSAEVLDITTGTWRRVEEVWEVSRCPRGRVSVGQNGDLDCLTESDPGIQVGSCVVDLGDRNLLTGAAFQGAPQTFFVADKKKQGQSCKLVKVHAPDEFSGFVQSGCFVEI